MTILKTESGTDFGIAGFKEKKGATYLVFPKSLKQFADKRVIGIDWTQSANSARLKARSFVIGSESAFGLSEPSSATVDACRAIPVARPARACQEDAHGSGEHSRLHLARN